MTVSPSAATSVSRSELGSSQLAALIPADDGLDLGRPPTASILVLGPGRTQRVDVWSGAVAAVLQGFRTDPDAAAAASVHLGRSAAAGAVAAILRSGTTDPEVRPSTSASSDISIAGLVERIPAGTSPFGADARAFVIHRASDGASVAVVPEAHMWGPVASDGTLELSVGRPALLWAFISSILPSAEVDPAAAQQAP